MPKLLMGRGSPGQPWTTREVEMPARDYAALLFWQAVQGWLYRGATFANARIDRRIARFAAGRGGEDRGPDEPCAGDYVDEAGLPWQVSLFLGLCAGVWIVALWWILHG